MYTRDFNIFMKMVDIAKQKELDYVIMYSYHIDEKSQYLHSYSFILSTNLFEVSIDKRVKNGDNIIIENFIRNNDCIKLDFRITLNTQNKEYIELS